MVHRKRTSFVVTSEGAAVLERMSRNANQSRTQRRHEKTAKLFILALPVFGGSNLCVMSLI